MLFDVFLIPPFKNSVPSVQVFFVFWITQDKKFQMQFLHQQKRFVEDTVFKICVNLKKLKVTF